MSTDDLHHQRLLYSLKLTTHHDLAVVTLTNDELETVLLIGKEREKMEGDLYVTTWDIRMQWLSTNDDLTSTANGEMLYNVMNAHD